MTVHYVDAGVDTGNVIGHSLIKPTKEDSFVTYPYLRLSKGIEILKLFFNNSNNNLLHKINVKESKQYYHPSVLEYLFFLIKRGIK